jgi:hypothetical protein
VTLNFSGLLLEWGTFLSSFFIEITILW